MKKKCACCASEVFEENSNFDICPVCFWEDDFLQNENPNFEGGANNVSLNQAKLNFKNFGAIEPRFIEYVISYSDYLAQYSK